MYHITDLCDEWCDGLWLDQKYLHNEGFLWAEDDSVYKSADGFYWLCTRHYLQWLFFQIAKLQL